jgi:pyruvate formate lyase activating enzyme
MKTEARHYRKSSQAEVQCALCPHMCVLAKDETGLCHARTNRHGVLYTDNYGVVTSLCADPIEKKPLYHFFPGRNILSVGSFGCNFRCGWCQNASISQHGPEHFASLPYTSPRDVVNATGQGLGLAYTYNEPTVFFEFMKDMAVLAHDAGLKNVMVTNAHINKKPLEELLPLLHAVNADLKSFSPEFYRHHAGGSLRSVKNSLKTIAARGIHLELTMLVIPGLNDNKLLFTEMTDWIASELGPKTVLHLSRYFPAGKMRQPPTPIDLLIEFHEIAKNKLSFVYLGNVPGQHETSSTFCPNCGWLVIERRGYSTDIAGIDESGCCMHCHENICVR